MGLGLQERLDQGGHFSFTLGGEDGAFFILVYKN